MLSLHNIILNEQYTVLILQKLWLVVASKNRYEDEELLSCIAPFYVLS